MAATTPAAVSLDYGLDAPRVVRSMFGRAGWMLGVAGVLYFINHSEYPGPAARMCGVLALGGLLCLATGWIMVWSSRVAKLRVRDRMLDSLALKGDEKILDVGCGRGLLAIGAAKRLGKTGRVTGIDVWSPVDLSGNTAEAAKANAKLEGVADKVRIEDGDARKLVYPESNYDVVVSSLAIHNIPDHTERSQAVREMYRVLKPGGKLLIYDIFKPGEYAETLRACGAKDVTLSEMMFLWCLPSRIVSARK
jgi:arsenite methyltransferase